MSYHFHETKPKIWVNRRMIILPKNIKVVNVDGIVFKTKNMKYVAVKGEKIY